MKKYFANEIFYSLQGEGARAGSANVFIRFSGCNLTCGGETIDGIFQPVCDTDFSGGRSMTADELVEEVSRFGGACKEVILTGGEPALQIDDELIAALKAKHFYIAIETNGTRVLPAGIDWVCCSPKTANHTLKLSRADELKYVMREGMALPKPSVHALHYFLSPAFEPEGNLTRANLAWCVKLIKENPKWRLSCQQHKWWNVR